MKKENKVPFIVRLDEWCTEHEGGLKILLYFLLLAWLGATVETVKSVITNSLGDSTNFFAIITLIGAILFVLKSSFKLIIDAYESEE